MNNFKFKPIVFDQCKFNCYLPEFTKAVTSHEEHHTIKSYETKTKYNQSLPDVITYIQMKINITSSQSMESAKTQI